MSTEPKSLETNALASRLSRGWDQFRKGQLVSYRVMALVLLVAAGGFVWWYIASERSKDKSRAWIALDGSDSAAALEKFWSEHKNEPIGRLAGLHLARTLIGPEGIDSLPPRPISFEDFHKRDPKTALEQYLAAEKADLARQPAAIANIEKARGIFEELAAQFTDPTLKSECYEGIAKAEAVLLGKEGLSADDVRQRVVRLREAGGSRPPKRGPRMAPTDYRAI